MEFMGENIQPKAVNVTLLGGGSDLVEISHIMNFATECVGSSDVLDASMLFESLKGDCRTVAAFNAETKELVGYLSSSLDESGVLNVGWFLARPGFIPGGLMEDMLILIATKLSEVRGIRSKFEPRLYSSIYRRVGMIYNKKTSCWELIEMHS